MALYSEITGYLLCGDLLHPISSKAHSYMASPPHKHSDRLATVRASIDKYIAEHPEAEVKRHRDNLLDKIISQKKVNHLYIDEKPIGTSKWDIDIYSGIENKKEWAKQADFFKVPDKSISGTITAKDLSSLEAAFNSIKSSTTENIELFLQLEKAFKSIKDTIAKSKIQDGDELAVAFDIPTDGKYIISIKKVKYPW